MPEREGTWASFSGTSMASPHVAGAVALLLQQHPDWTVDQVTSALVQTGRPVLDPETEGETLTTREGGGLVNLPAADIPLVFVKPSVVSLGLLRVGTTRRVRVDVTDAGGGAGSWNVSLRLQASPGGVKLAVPSTVSVPGRFELVAESEQTATEQDLTGFVILQRGNATRRIPFWLRTTHVKLGPPARVLTKQGRYEGNTRNGKANVTSYRYPDDPSGLGVTNSLPGPEQVFRVRVGRGAANVGARITRQPKGVSVTPRIVYAGDENRLRRRPLATRRHQPVPGRHVRPAAPGRRDEPAAAGRLRSRLRDPLAVGRGPFSFRLWIDDATPPRVKLLTPTARSELVLSVADSGSGIDPRSVVVRIDGLRVVFKVSPARIRVPLEGIYPGKHRLQVIVPTSRKRRTRRASSGSSRTRRILRATFTVR